MNEKQFYLIASKLIKRDDEKTMRACSDVILHGSTIYAAEKTRGCIKGTLGRKVRAIQSNYDHAVEVCSHEK